MYNRGITRRNKMQEKEVVEAIESILDRTINGSLKSEESPLVLIMKIVTKYGEQKYDEGFEFGQDLMANPL
jgi:hypothetical protein